MKYLACLIIVILATGCDRVNEFKLGNASLAPDGESVVMSLRTGQIYRLVLRSSELKPLTDSADTCVAPTYSPDGTRIAYSRIVRGNSHIWLMDSDGSNQTQLTYGQVIHENPTFSKAGDALYFDRFSLSAGSVARFGATCRLQLKDSQVIEVSRRLGHTVNDISPNEEELVYALRTRHQNREDSEIWIFNRRTNRKLLVGKGLLPKFSPSGARIVCLPVEDAHGAIQLMNRDGSKVQLISVPYGPKLGLGFCENREAVIFRTQASERGGRGAIYILDLETKECERLLPLQE